MEHRITDLEETVAHMAREVEDLSTVVARQADEIALLTRKVQLLMEREAQREAAEGAAEIIGDERPPHW